MLRVSRLFAFARLVLVIVAAIWFLPEQAAAQEYPIAESSWALVAKGEAVAPALPASSRAGFTEGGAGLGLPRMYITKLVDGQMRCSEASPEEVAAFAKVDPQIQLHVLKRIYQEKSQAGLTIVLRSTPQLDQYPQAKAAFARAAARWESVILNPITIIIDVDFGPTRFGAAYENSNILGSTDTDLRTGPYSSLRSALLATLPSSPLYQALPNGLVPTDIGSTSTVRAPSPTLQMLGLLPAPSLAAPFGSVPNIAFNSAVNFDFDPTDGISTGLEDFDSVATHEIGHALGFSSEVGQFELNPSGQVTVSVWDLFRFRPGISLPAFSSAPRILSSGGEQIFFDVDSSVPLSTGRPDGTGGDLHQASHWKDDAILGSYIGIMDPTLAAGTRKSMRIYDLEALYWIGYNIGPVQAPASISSLSPSSITAGASSLNLTINGGGFVSGATVLWKGQARAATFISPTQLAVSLGGADTSQAGASSVEVVNPNAIASNTVYETISAPLASCTPNSTTLCLNGGRFQVRAAWQSTTASGQGTAVSLTPDTGYFWFFNSANVEMIVKVLDACALNGRKWVFSGGLTDVNVVLTVTDAQTGAVRTYVNPRGTAYQPVQDTSAFSTCP
jgi:hypothetical protein